MCSFGFCASFPIENCFGGKTRAEKTGALKAFEKEVLFSKHVFITIFIWFKEIKVFDSFGARSNRALGVMHMQRRGRGKHSSRNEIVMKE